MTETISTDICIQRDDFSVRFHGIGLSQADASTNVSSLHVLVYIQSAYTYSNAELG